MLATPELTRLVLRKLAADAKANSATLLATLQAAAFGTVAISLSGKVLIEAQSSGVRTRYELPVASGSLDIQGVSAMLSRLLDLYDAATAALSAGVDDGAICTWMLAQLKPVRSFAADHSNALIR